MQSLVGPLLMYRARRQSEFGDCCEEVGSCDVICIGGSAGSDVQGHVVRKSNSGRLLPKNVLASAFRPNRRRLVGGAVHHDHRRRIALLRSRYQLARNGDLADHSCKVPSDQLAVSRTIQRRAIRSLADRESATFNATAETGIMVSVLSARSLLFRRLV
jgi:hypothetical protein